jgi:lysophospholipase L1-like esterase
VSAKTAAQTAQTGAETAAASVEASAAQIATNAEDISQLKSGLSEITEYAYGKNRFDSSNCVDGYVLLEDGQPYPTSGWSISNYCYVKGFSQIFGSALNANNIRNAFSLAYICSYDSNKEFIERISTMALNPVSIDNDVAYVRFCLQNTNLDKDVMLEGGSSFTAYEPYSKTLVSKTDKTLTSNLLPANAKAVGENIGKVKDQLSYSAVNFTLIDSKFLNGDTGAITDASGTNNKVSNYIEIVPNSKIMITTEHFWSQGLYAFYDKDKNFISGKESNSGGTVTQIYNEIAKAPINAKYLVIGFLYQASMPEPFVFQGVTQDANPSSIWADKKWTVVGDSLTAYNGKTSMHYFDYIAGATGINIVNMGVSGSGYAKLTDNFMARVLNVPTDADVVTIFGSGNDASAGLDLGTASDTGTETLGGVINTTIDNLYSIMPIVNLGIVTPTPWQGNMPYDNGWMENYSNMIVEICRRRSIPCLDLFHCSNLNPNSEQVRQLAYSKDEGGGVHPNELGHKIIASRFLAFLESLLLH